MLLTVYRIYAVDSRAEYVVDSSTEYMVLTLGRNICC
jgi:hypothetical protein